MVTEIRIYAEGGGNDNPSRRTFRTGLNQFLQPICQLARAERIRWQVIPCGSRGVAFRDFKTALRTHPDALNVLLVDSEDVVILSPWHHLERRDGWKTSSLLDEQCHLMVHCMESWLIADPSALAEFYGQGFRPNALPRTADVETVAKERIAAALEHATKDTQKGRYHKIRHGPDLLGRLDSARVRQRAKHCDRLFVVLETLILSARKAV
jgi:hypothetical protein